MSNQTADTQGATLTTAEVAALCRINRKTVSAWIAYGYLPRPLNPDMRVRRFSAAEVKACLDRKRGA